MSRDALPSRRDAVTFNFEYKNKPFVISIGLYKNGMIGEIFINGGKSGEDIEAVVRDAAVLMSLALQHGTSLATIRHALTRNSDGSASGIVCAVVDTLQKEFPEL